LKKDEKCEIILSVNDTLYGVNMEKLTQLLATSLLPDKEKQILDIFIENFVGEVDIEDTIKKALTEVFIENKENTSDDEPANNNSWIQNWYILSYGKKAPKNTHLYCSNLGCDKESANISDLNGAHVIEYGAKDGEVYIIPLCDKCNQSCGPIRVFAGGLIPRYMLKNME